MEVFAGFTEHVDVQIGRMVDEIDRLGYGDHLIVQRSQWLRKKKTLDLILRLNSSHRSIFLCARCATGLAKT